MTDKQLRQFIIKNNNDCALLIGNGINRYANSGCSWDILLKALTKVHCPDFDLDELPKDGISNTEFFDLLEVYYLKETPIFDEEEFRRQMVSLSMTNRQANKIYDRIKEFALTTPKKISDLDKCHVELEKHKEALTFQSTSIDFDWMMTLASLSDNKLRAVVRNKFITSICAYMKNWEFQPIHHNVALFAKKYRLPILTTNYDTLLEDSVKAKEHNYVHQSSSELFPISLCYTNDQHPDYNNWGVWHINGVIHYPKSILIGLSHYMRSIESIRKLLLPSNKLEVEIIRGQFTNSLKNTWINLVLSRHLIIFGLSLDKDETLLRWLLIERAKLFAMFPFMTKKGIYVMPETEKLENGKSLFFKYVGIEIVRVKDYESMYKIISA